MKWRIYVCIDRYLHLMKDVSSSHEWVVWFWEDREKWFGWVDLTWVVNEWMMKMMERQFQLYLFMASADSFHLWGWKRQLYSTAFLSFLSQQLTITVVQNLYFYTIGSVLCEFCFNSGAARIDSERIKFILSCSIFQKLNWFCL
jgi:hypothetical protein